MFLILIIFLFYSSNDINCSEEEPSDGETIKSNETISCYTISDDSREESFVVDDSFEEDGEEYGSSNKENIPIDNKESDDDWTSSD